ncbi:MAG: hypothetical protein AABZ44_06205 [Elusimicrobiota bacterium]
MKHRLEFALFRLLLGLVALLPWSKLPAVSRVLGDAARCLLRRRNAIVLDNLSHAFPQAAPPWRAQVAKDFWRNIVLTILECLAIQPTRNRRLKKIAILENFDVLERALSCGKGTLIHTGHLGNWELNALRIAIEGIKVAGIGRKQKNPFFDAWLVGWREQFGSRAFSHHQVGKDVREWLASNGSLGILLDHNLYKGGIFVDFFGRPAATTTLTALLHIKYGSPIVGAYNYRKNGRLYCVFELIDTSAVTPGKDAARQITEILTKKIEEWIRRDPANWLWGHSRWKRQPQEA